MVWGWEILEGGCYEPSPRQRRLRCWRLGGDGCRLLRGWGWGEGEGVGVGPLIHAPFLLEHSCWGIPGSSSVVTAGRRVFVSSEVEGWGWEFFGLRVRALVRERLGRITLRASLPSIDSEGCSSSITICNTWAPAPSSVAHINASFPHLPLMLRNTQRRQHPPHRTARERNGCDSRHSPTRRSMLEFQHSLYSHSKCLRTL